MYSTAAAATQTPASKSEEKKASLGSYEQISDSLLFGGQRNADPMGDGSSMRTDAKGKGRERPNGDVLALDLNAAEEGYGIQNGPFAQMQLVEQQVRFF